MSAWSPSRPNELTIGDPTDPGSEVAFSLETCSIAALLSVMMTARDYPSAFAPPLNDMTDLSVELKEAFSSTLLGVERTNGE
jgi:hypothetical protein